jgi:TonB-linked SusC/RagA family outer membrane protein
MRLNHLLTLILMMGISTSMWGQRAVTGTVTDTEGEALIGVNILVKGTSTGAVTDIDGQFEISVPTNNSVLIFRYVGYDTREITVGDQTDLEVIMREDAEVLDEVVVSALGFKQRKDEMGSTYSTVATEDINRTGETTLLNSLGGRAAGVQIQRSNGDPGAGTTIRIRGANTISGSSNPLIILDGIPISNSTIYGGGNNVTGGRTGGTTQQSRLNDINPNDIESVQILKGASAAALWGSRAANGVLVITTKSGSSGKPRINYKVTRSFDDVLERIPMQSLYGQGRGGSYSPTRAESWGDYIPDRAGGSDDVNRDGERFIARDGTEYFPITGKNDRSTFVDSNWDQVFQTGGFWQHDLSVSGGNDRATYFFSLGNLDQEGIIRNSDYNRTNLRLNNRFFLSDWLTISSKAGYTATKSNRIQQSSNTAGLLLGLLRTPPDFDNRDYLGTHVNEDGQEFTNRHRSYRRYLGQTQNPVYNNPGWTAFEQVSETDVDRFIMSADIDINPAPWLTFTLRGGVDASGDVRTYLFPIGSGGSRNVGILAEDEIREQELNFDAIAKANFSLSSDIGLNTTLGWNINDRTRRISSYQVTGFLVNSDKPTTDLNGSQEASAIDNFRRFIRSNRGYGVLAFDFYDELFVNMSGGLEAASTVQGTFFYPAIDAAWQFTKSAVSTSDFLTFGKLRASWGQVGVQPAPHRFQTPAESGFTYSTYSDPLDIGLFGGGFRLDDDRGNPNLKPEIKTEWEIGVDLRLFRDKLSLTATYYQNRIEDLLFGIDLTPSSGFDTEYTNAGSMENVGFEMEAGYTLFENDAWNIGVNANFNANENTVTRLRGAESINLTGGSVSSRAVEGFPLGALWGTGSQTDENGNFILDDNGFPQLTPNPIVLGDPNPDWRGGLSFDISWKNFRFNALIEHSQGGDFSPRTLWVLRRFGTTQETANRVTLDQPLVNYAGEVIPAGTTVRGNVRDFGGGPVLLDESWYRTGIGGGFGDNQAYNFSLFDATFTRIRELSLGYNWNSEWLKNTTKLGSIQFTLTGRNLFLWDDIPGIDPEVNQVGVNNGFGLDYFTNPTAKSFLFSISVNY